MKPQDLRIGNYVRIKATGVIVQVCSISKRKIGFHYSADKTRMYYRNFSEIEPVLIYEFRNALSEIASLSNHLMWADKALCEDLYYYDRIPLSDLHELQNIHYALTGNEIEIEI